MTKNPSVRTLLDSAYVKLPERLLKSARKYFYYIYWSLWERMSLENSFLVLSEILRLFLDILTHNDKYSLPVKASV